MSSHVISLYLFNTLPAVETGEEGEDTVFTCRAKLYHFEPDTKEWKERGVGQFKINTAWAPPTEDSEHSTPKSRLIMRTDGVHRVVLNTPIFKGMKVGTSDGGVPKGKTINITGSEGDKMGLFLLKVRLSRYLLSRAFGRR